MRRLTTTIAATALCTASVFGLAACGSSKSSPEEPVPYGEQTTTADDKMSDGKDKMSDDKMSDGKDSMSDDKMSDDKMSDDKDSMSDDNDKMSDDKDKDGK